MLFMNQLFIRVVPKKIVFLFLKDFQNLKFGTDFKVGFSPERINPGDTNHTLTKIVKVTSGCDH